jgi:dTDP-4-amino-4,6-dideoxygalactose transaminase
LIVETAGAHHHLKSGDNLARKDFLVFGSPLIGGEEIDDVTECLRSGWLGTGPRVAKFETDFAAFMSAPHAIAVSSCTAALHLSLVASNIAPGDEVITTAMTFCATVNAIIHAGGTPVLADCDPRTMNIDVDDVERKITPRTRAIIPVHFAGRPCDMGALCDLATKRNLKIIEDCAHAIETEYKGRKVGTFGEFGCFSFYVTKNVITGEGGMVLTPRKELADRIKILALHGMSKDAWKRFGDEGYKHYDVVECGFKYNMMDVQAAIGIHQLRRVEQNWKRRAAIWQTYTRELSSAGVCLPPPPDPDTRHALHLYTVLIDTTGTVSRDRFLDEMTKRKIGVGVHYRSIADHPFYQRTFGWRSEDYPNARSIGERTVSLPLSAKLTDHDVDDVITAIRSILDSAA